jgi:hypothetical protein
MRSPIEDWRPANSVQGSADEGSVSGRLKEIAKDERPA